MRLLFVPTRCDARRAAPPAIVGYFLMHVCFGSSARYRLPVRESSPFSEGKHLFCDPLSFVANLHRGTAAVVARESFRTGSACSGPETAEIVLPGVRGLPLSKLAELSFLD